MINPKRHIGPVLLVCLAFSFLLSYAGPTLTHPAKPSSSTVLRGLGHIPPAVPLLLAARSQLTPYDRLACRLAERAPWLQDFQTEILQFPHGRHDDQVDSLSQFLMWITKPRHYGPQIRSL